MPMLKPDRLVNAIAYADGQFDDAMYNLALLQSFTKSGGEALNYARVAKPQRSIGPGPSTRWAFGF
jgi:glycerol-3-phosphate dehydrogenase